MKNKKHKNLFKVEKPMFIIVTMLSIFILLAFILWIIGLCTTKKDLVYANSQESTSITSGTIEFNEGDDNTLPSIRKKDSNNQYTDEFKVSVIGDLHLSDYNDLSLKVVENYIQIEHPDLVVLNGDVISINSNMVVIERLNEMFERNNQYWTFTLGNHDNEYWKLKQHMSVDESRQAAYKAIAKYNEETKKPSPHCLARAKLNDPSGLNHALNIIGKDNKVLKTLIMTDCDCIHKQELIDWYKNLFNHFNVNDSILINHIPFNEFKYAYQHINKDSNVKYLYGTNFEDMCNDRDSTLFWNTITSVGKTKDILFAHDHLCNTSLIYKGIRMTYGLGLAYDRGTLRSYSVKALFKNFEYMIDSNLCIYIDGVTNLYFKDNKMITGNSYAQFNGTLNGLSKELYIATWGAITHGNGLTIFNRIVFPLATIGCLTYYGFFIYYHKKYNYDEQ